MEHSPTASAASAGLDRLRIVLVETSHPGNVGAAARAMKTMGIRDLVLLNPRHADVCAHEEALAFASGAQDVLAGARTAKSFDDALAGCRYAVAVSARLREFSPPVTTPREFANEQACTERPAAIVFGNERYGLPNEIVERCNALVNIPANPGYSSLNLAQAVQVLTYECRMASMAGAVAELPSIGFTGDPASISDIDGMFAHLEDALKTIGFLDPKHPKKLMPRLRRLFARTQLEVEEVNILRGIARHILVHAPGKHVQDPDEK